MITLLESIQLITQINNNTVLSEKIPSLLLIASLINPNIQVNSLIKNDLKIISFPQGTTSNTLELKTKEGNFPLITTTFTSDSLSIEEGL